jgi:predicted phage gp36 major capsid-like protein
VNLTPDKSRRSKTDSRIGFVIESIPHLFAAGNNLPSGQRGLFGYARNGSAVVDETAGALLNVT